MFKMNENRMLEHLFALGKVGIDAEGHRTRACASDTEKEGRDLVSG